MGLDGDFQSGLPNGNGQKSSQAAPFNAAEFSMLEEDNFDLRQILAVARRRIVIIAGVAIAVSAGVAAKVLKQVPKYEGKFQLLVGPVSGEDKVDKLTKSLSKDVSDQIKGPDYETQMQVLWSPQVMTPILKKIQAQYPDINYETLRGQLALSRLKDTKILEVRYQDSDPDKIKFVLEQVAKGYINYSETEQRTAVKQGLSFVNEQTKQLKDRVDSLQKELQELRQRYNIIDPETQGQLLTSSIGQITQQRQQAETQLRETEQLSIELQNQLRDLGVAPEQALAASALSEATRYQQLLNKLSEVESKIAAESARFTEESPNLQALREQQQRLQPLVNQEAAKVLGTTPAGIPSNAETLASPSSIRLEVTKKLAEATNQRKVLEERAKAIAQAEVQLNQQLTNWPIIARNYTDLQQKLKVATESLGRFLAVQETLQIEDAQKTGSWQAISQIKKPEMPISPNVPRGLLMGAIAGLLAGAGAAFLAEKLDKVFHSPDELKDSTGLPILGMIPFTKEVKSYLESTIIGSIPDTETQQFKIGGQTHRYITSPFLEAFRALHTNLEFLSPDQPIRSLVMSSAVPADGKSTTATFLAQAAAAMGQRVLLVDADLRRPQIHVRTDLPNVWGLSNVISSEIRVDDVIQQSPIEDNLFVLTAGQIPPDPTRLLSSKKMRDLVERFHETYDLVIFDTPPLLGLADARLLAAHTDGIVMVVGLGRTNREVFKQVLYGLKTSRARVLGVIANGVKGYTANSYDYYHRYYAEAPVGKPLSRGRR
ncbi:MAG TPA: polysaccharide biosynthesis tyrosine autokinase [Coleofasciculaceae cyanobacterium]|jgi:capsular exopolysaccharide synthesis family protein